VVIKLRKRLNKTAYKASSEVSGDIEPIAGIQDFSFGGIVLGLRYWVPSSTYFSKPVCR
jgi:hypothetical protein